MPLPRPLQILAVGRNYAAHARELDNQVVGSPLLFWKPVGSLAPAGVCALPRWETDPPRALPTRIDYEGEIALVLGRDLGPGSPPLPDDPWEVVSGICAAIDVTDRTLQKEEPQWVRGKGFACACAVGPLAPRPHDPERMGVRTWLNGRLVQDGHSRDLLFPFRDLLVYLHGFCPLFGGDVILTGTPEGVGPVAAGDVVRVEVRDELAPDPPAGLVGPADPGFLSQVALSFSEGGPVPPFRRAAWRRLEAGA